jgi:hypothetical protein
MVSYILRFLVQETLHAESILGTLNTEMTQGQERT